MTNSNSLLSGYETLVQNHANQFDPEIAGLQQIVNKRMQEIRHQERSLVEAQARELRRITDALAADARCFLPTPQFGGFVQEFKKMKTNYWGRSQSKPTLMDNPTSWLLATLDLPVSLSNYQTEENHDGYDDERTYSSYGYSLSLKLGGAEEIIGVEHKRIYTLNEFYEYSQKEQIEDNMLGMVEGLLRKIKYPEAERNQLALEISVLIGYAGNLFALKPRTASFIYQETQEN